MKFRFSSLRIAESGDEEASADEPWVRLAVAGLGHGGDDGAAVLLVHEVGAKDAGRVGEIREQEEARRFEVPAARTTALDLTRRSWRVWRSRKMAPLAPPVLGSVVIWRTTAFGRTSSLPLGTA